tara:strand:- start:2555 stop:3784 length:1230 start_codon:yes stop_codon:yes gene_type:complete
MLTNKTYAITLAYTDLSIIELESFLRSRNVNYISKGQTGRTLLFEVEKLPSDIAKVLGGYHKLGKILVESNNFDNESSLTNSLDKATLFSFLKDKSRWAISVYSDKDDLSDNMESFLRDYLKSRLKKEQIKKTNPLKSLYSKNITGELEISSQIIQNENLLNTGFEIIAVNINNKWFFGKTINVIDHIKFKERDFSKPIQDSQISIPPKIARILVNLTGCNSRDVILDPFCGIGIILTEAIMLNLHVLGLDVVPSRVSAARKNLKWVSSKYKLQNKIIYNNIKAGNAENISEYFQKESIDGIASEPILVPTLKHFPSIKEAENILKSAEKVYTNSLPEMEKVLKHNGKIALVVPCIKTIKDKILTFDIIESAIDLGLKINQPTKLNEHHLLVNDKSQKVMRSIYVFEKP